MKVQQKLDALDSAITPTKKIFPSYWVDRGLYRMNGDLRFGKDDPFMGALFVLSFHGMALLVGMTILHALAPANPGVFFDILAYSFVALVITTFAHTSFLARASTKKYRALRLWDGPLHPIRQLNSSLFAQVRDLQKNPSIDQAALEGSLQEFFNLLELHEKQKELEDAYTCIQADEQKNTLAKERVQTYAQMRTITSTLNDLFKEQRMIKIAKEHALKKVELAHQQAMLQNSGQIELVHTEVLAGQVQEARELVRLEQEADKELAKFRQQF